MTHTIQNNTDLLGYLVEQAGTGRKDWFGFSQQKIVGINLCYDIARNHADTMSPDQVVQYVLSLNNAIFKTIIMGK
jgi:hypothetical protein